MKLFNKFRVYRLRTPLVQSLQDLVTFNEQLAQFPRAEPLPFQIDKHGFNKVLDGQHGYATILPSANMAMPVYIELSKIERIVPSKAWQREVTRAVAAIEEKEDRKVYSKEKAEIKHQVLQEMLPHAFKVESAIRAFIVGTFVFIDQTSTNNCLVILDMIREAIGSLPVRPLAVKDRTEISLTYWAKEDRVPDSQTLSVGHSFKSVCNSGKGDTLSGSDVDLSQEDIQACLSSGRMVTELGLLTSLENGSMDMQFTLDDALSFKNVKWPSEFIDHVDDMLGSQEYEEADLAKANLILVCNGVCEIVDAVIEALGGEPEVEPTHDETELVDDDEDLL